MGALGRCPSCPGPGPGLNMTVTQYYSKLKKLWDEIVYLEPIPTCLCGAEKAMGDIFESHKIIQFLMGLNEDYDHSRNQILIMDPLPTVNKVYSMILKVEKQRVTTMVNTENSEITALRTKTQVFGGRNGNGRKNMTQDKTGYDTKDYTSRKGNYGRSRVLSRQRSNALRALWNTGMSGHTMMTCFKIHGFPNWYKNLKNQRMKGPARVNMASTQLETPLNCENAEAHSHEDGSHHLPAYEMDMSAIIQKETMKNMKDKGSFAHAHFSQTSFAGDDFFSTEIGLELGEIVRPVR